MLDVSELLKFRDNKIKHLIFMHHVAIMKKSWGLTEKILSGEKRIESRWYKSKCSPWGKINAGDTVYFKNSGEPVTINADVENVISFSDLTPEKIKNILEKYAKDDGIKDEQIEDFYKLFKDKKYCLLIFLKNPRRVEPFEIDKKGFGAMAAWLAMDNINIVKKKS